MNLDESNMSGSDWRRLFRLERSGRRVDEDVDAELSFHIDERVDELLAGGMDEEEARAEVMKQFGDVDRISAACRNIDEERLEGQRRREFFASVGQDVRFAFRTLRRSPVFTAIAVLTLGLGIGANTAIFSVIYGVLLQPLPYQQGEQLVLIRQSAPGAGANNMNFSPKEVFDYREQTETLDGVVEYHSMWFSLLGREEPERVQTGVVSANFFDVLGVQPHLGRTFREGEDEIGAEPVLVLSYEYWQRSHGSDPGVVGRQFEMNDKIHTVVGVLPPIPQYPRDNDVYMPVSACPFRSAETVRENRNARMMPNVFGRLRPGLKLEQGQADMATIASRLQQDYPESYSEDSGFTATLEPLDDTLTQNARPTLLILLITAGLVLLIACANVANLTLARLIRREKEMALRSALGAGRRRLLRQLLTESTIVALMGGVIGLVIAWQGLDLLISFAARFTPRAFEVGIDAPVLVFTLLISVATGLLFGSLPALPSTSDLAAPLKDAGARSRTVGGPQRLRSMLIVAQVAVSFVLLIGAGLMARSLYKLTQVDAGFNPENVLAMEIDLDWSKYNSIAERMEYFNPLLERVNELPGVLSAAVARTFPLNESGLFNTGFDIEGRLVDEAELRPVADFRIASPQFFQTVGVPLLRGRVFTDMDHEESIQVAILNRSLAEHHWQGEDPIGRRITFDGGDTWVTIVGVVGDVRQRLEVAAQDEVYVPYAQVPTRQTNLLVRTRANPLLMAKQVINEAYEVDANQPVANVRTVEQVRSEYLASPRLTAVLLALFAGLALAITVTGIAGVIAFSVSQRTQEIGIRMALGAEQSSVLGMVLRQGMLLVAIGLALGVAGALGITRLMSGLLFEVEPTDPITFIFVALVLAAVAAVATFVPARRATTVDPVLALRTN
ncbi:MAG: ABC transporter permease [Gemmatimonadota bacterium]